MKISVVIPCYLYSSNSIKWLKECIDSFSVSTIFPYEIILVIDGRLCPDKNLDFLFNKQFLVKIVLSTTRNFSAVSRQIASDIAFGDIICYQDCDDISHPQRLEIINYFFETKDIVCIHHGGTTVDNKNFNKMNDFKKIEDFSKLKTINSDELFKAYFKNGKWPPTPGCEHQDLICYAWPFCPVMAGVPAVRKNIFSKIKWRQSGRIKTDLPDIPLRRMCFSKKYKIEDNPDIKEINEFEIGQDQEFAMEVLYEFRKSLVINESLYNYRKWK